MPILKVISGHTTCQNIKRYLEKRNRALARDFFNLSWDERALQGYDESLKAAVEWADEMDSARKLHGNDKAHEGRKARTYKHFVVSPDPEDSIDLPALRELAGAWAMRYFPDHQVAIVYHDDNTRGIPHAHVVVNNTNLKTGRRLQTKDPLSLNRGLQEMARQRGLSGLSNQMPETEGVAKLAAGARKKERPRSLDAVYTTRAEREIVNSGEYSWVADIRNRVGVARSLARNEDEFRRILQMLDVGISDNSAKAKRQDWIYFMADRPVQKVTGGRLGFIYGKENLQQRFASDFETRFDDASSRELLKAAKSAIALKDLDELDQLSAALNVCARYGVTSMKECAARISALEARISRDRGCSPASAAALADLTEARSFLSEKGLLPEKPTARLVLQLHDDEDDFSARGKRSVDESRPHARQRDERSRGQR